MIEQTQVGAIQLLRTSLGPVGPVVPEVNVFNMPFVFRDINHMRAVIDGPIGQELLDKVSASPAKMVALAWMAALDQVAEGQQHTLGAYHRSWK